MINYKGSGDIVTVAAPEDASSGEFLRKGGIHGVAGIAVSSGADVPLHRKGVYTLPKETGAAWTVGDQLFWNASTKVFSKDVTDSPVAAVAAAAAGSDDATGDVLLLGSGTQGGLEFRAGTGTLDGGNPTPVTTGLTAAAGGVAVLKSTSAPGVGTSVLTCGVSAGTLNVYAWKPTSNSDPTMVASTGTEDFFWIAWGV